MGEHLILLNANVPVIISPLIQMEPSAGEDAVGHRKKQVAWSVVLGPGSLIPATGGLWNLHVGPGTVLE